MQYKHLLVFRHEPWNELGRKNLKMQLQQGGEDQMKGSLALPTLFTSELSQIYTYFTSTYFFLQFITIQSGRNSIRWHLDQNFFPS